MNPASMQKMTQQGVAWYFLSGFYRHDSSTWGCRHSTEVPVTQLHLAGALAFSSGTLLSLRMEEVTYQSSLCLRATQPLGISSARTGCLHLWPWEAVVGDGAGQLGSQPLLHTQLSLLLPPDPRTPPSSVERATAPFCMKISNMKGHLCVWDRERESTAHNVNILFL